MEMNHVETHPGAPCALMKSCPKWTIHPVLSGLILIVAALSVAVAAGEDQPKDFPGLGKPRTLFVADGDWTQGSWRSLAFTQDNRSLIGSLVRNPGSRTLFLLGQRGGEVRSFDLAAGNQASKIVTTGRDMQFEILKARSGACQEPLLLAAGVSASPKKSSFSNSRAKTQESRCFDTLNYLVPTKTRMFMIALLLPLQLHPRQTLSFSEEVAVNGKRDLAL